MFFLHTFNLVAQSPRASWFFPPSVLFIAAFSSLAGKYGCSKTSIQELKKIYIFQLPDKARKLDHLNIGDITCQCIYIVICRHVFLTYTRTCVQL